MGALRESLYLSSINTCDVDGSSTLARKRRQEKVCQKGKHTHTNSAVGSHGDRKKQSWLI